jgi:hypothetical protein
MKKQIYYRKLRGYKYELLMNYFINVGIKGFDITTRYIDLSPSGLMRIKKDYAWDGASGPTIDTKSSMRGSLVHDAIYQLIRFGKLPLSCRKVADALLEKICLEDGMWRIRAFGWERAVRWFAGICCRPKSEKPEEICCAPEKVL